MELAVTIATTTNIIRLAFVFDANMFLSHKGRSMICSLIANQSTTIEPANAPSQLARIIVAGRTSIIAMQVVSETYWVMV